MPTKKPKKQEKYVIHEPANCKEYAEIERKKLRKKK